MASLKTVLAAGGLAGAGMMLLTWQPADAGQRHWFYDSYPSYRQEAYQRQRGWRHRPRLYAPWRRYGYVAPHTHWRDRYIDDVPVYVPRNRKWRNVRIVPEAGDSYNDGRGLRRKAPATGFVPRPKARPELVPGLSGEADVTRQALKQPAVSGTANAAARATGPAVAVEKAKKKKRTTRSGGGITCERGSEIIQGFGFSDIKSTSCKGKVYGFEATRDGKPFTIKLSSLNGQLKEVKRR